MVARSRSSRIASIIVLSLTITLGIIDILTFNRHLGSSQIVLIFLISIMIALSAFMFITLVSAWFTPDSDAYAP